MEDENALTGAVTGAALEGVPSVAGSPVAGTVNVAVGDPVAGTFTVDPTVVPLTFPAPQPWAPLGTNTMPMQWLLQPPFSGTGTAPVHFPPWCPLDGGVFSYPVPGGWLYSHGGALAFGPSPAAHDSPAGKVQKCECCAKTFSHMALVRFCGAFCAEKTLGS